MALPDSSRVYFNNGGIGVDLLIILKKIDDMKLKGDYDIDESGRYTVIFENENGEEWEVEFKIWIDKEYRYEETGKFLTDVNVTAKCMDPGFTIDEELSMEMELEEYITNSFNFRIQ